MSGGRGAWWPGFLLGIAVVLPSAFLLDDYGVTWDEAYGDLFFGQRYLSYWTSFDPVFLDFESDPYEAGHSPDLRASPMRNVPQEHFPVSATAAAGVSRFATSAGLTDPLNGYHALNLFLVMLLIVTMHRWLLRREGMLVATAATLVLVTLPRVFYHQMVNIKDYPEMVMFTITIFAFVIATERDSLGWFALSGGLWGLALGIKANALFLPVIVVAWMVLERSRRSTLAKAAIAIPVGLLTLVVSWPWLWADPVGRLRMNLEYVIGRGALDVGASHANPLAMLLLTTPPLALFLSVMGLVIVLMRWKRIGPVGRLAAIWFAVILGRLLVPGAANFDGVRHFLEIFPAIAILVAISIRSFAEGGRGREAAGWLVVVVVTATSLFQIVRLHPFEVLYWNQFAGGSSGAVDAELPQASDYWATGYALGLDWLNENAPEGSALVVPIAQHTVMVARGEALRDDIEVLPVTHFWTRRVRPEDLSLVRETIASGRPVFGMTVLRRDWWNEIAEAVENGDRVTSWEVEGRPALIISRLD